ncbi:MAG: hypothetical protein U9P07_12040 [Pseudomonadota bacterium]|nr:hypothetical protein [Pseudomonadota bacterium]
MAHSLSADRQAVLAAWMGTVLKLSPIVIRGGRGDIALAVSPQAGHGRPARMSESHAGTSRKISFHCF